MKRYVVAVAITLPLFAGCQLLENLTRSSLSVQEQVELDQYQSRIAELEQAIRQQEQEAEATLETAVAEVRRGEASKLGQRVGGLLSLQERHEELVAEYVSVVSQERELLDAALGDRVNGVLAVAAPFIPAPIQPLVPFASTLLVFALSSRARKHTAKALAALAKGNLGEMAAALLRASGAAHSSEGTKAVAKSEGLA